MNSARLEAYALLRDRQYYKAYQKLSDLAEGGDSDACLLCGVMCESGEAFSGKPDFELAYKWFRRLHISSGDSEAALGCARICVLRGNPKDYERACALCDEALANQPSGFAYLTRGDVEMRLSSRPNRKLAKSLYFRAATNGAAWGLRRYANLLYDEGWRGTAILIHILATLAFPLYVLRYGLRATRPR